MKALLDNRFAPITFTCGFFESPFDVVSKAFTSWHTDIDAKFNTQTETIRFVAPLTQALERLEPLTTPLDRYLLLETRSTWTSIFSNGLRVNDVASPVAYLPTVLGCRGLQVRCIPDRSNMAGKGGFQIYGAISFTLNGPQKTDSLNRIRHVSVRNDVSGWEFAAGGEVQPYEQPENYRKRNIVDRFSPEMLESYCKALGIDLFEPGFYGDRCLLARIIRKGAMGGSSMSIAEARSHLHIQVM